MGIRFACHVCGKHLNIKRELAGRRGVCPSCAARFRIPFEDAEKSSPAESSKASVQSGGQLGTIATSVVSSAEPAAPAHSTGGEGVPTVSPLSDIASTELLDDAPDATWYVRPPSGGQYGPASSDILKQWIEEGRVAATALLWRDGWPQWRDASEALPELSGQLPSGNAHSQAQPSASQSDGASSSPSPSLSGQANVGADRRARSMRRLVLIGILVGLAAALIAVLVIVVNRSGG
jgi:hypothetical protein